MSKVKWMYNLEKMVNGQYEVLILAGYPEGFATWIQAVDFIRELLGSSSDAPVKTRCHAFFKLVEFYGFTPAGPYSVNVPFPDFK